MESFMTPTSSFNTLNIKRPTQPPFQFSQLKLKKEHIVSAETNFLTFFVIYFTIQGVIGSVYRRCMLGLEI